MQLNELHGLGKIRLGKLNEAGIMTLGDLLGVYPDSYMDTSVSVPIGQGIIGREMCIEGHIVARPKVQYINKLSIVRFQAQDDSGLIWISYFNQPWLAKQLSQGEKIVLYGRAQRKHGLYQMVNPRRVKERGIVPHYAPPAGIPSKTFASLIAQAQQEIAVWMIETIPDAILHTYHLMGRAEAAMQLHFPQSAAQLRDAKRRLSFEQLLLFQLAMRALKGQGAEGIVICKDEVVHRAVLAQLPYALTCAQQQVLDDIFSDFQSGRAMSRLVQGDVGSGKTIVAFMAAFHVMKAGFQAALMAPTEVLARQHYLNARRLLLPFGIRCGLLIGSLSVKEKKAMQQQIADGDIDFVIGTHALITKNVSFACLALAITDEQHRFGVGQRKKLQDKGREITPHVLVMSATPIPRTLALILYGDLDVSTIDERPPGRTPIQTRLVPDGKRDGLYGFLKDGIARGEQVYVVCPLIEAGDAAEQQSAENMYEELRTGVFSKARVGLVHGNQPAEEKDTVLARFGKGEIDVLVSTTVIEVGIDVPNATMMVIEDAEQFGLSQLHQLRGRVGRGSKQSWCFLMGEDNERLRTLCQTEDGFVIAQKDLDLRGPGELLGMRQHGHLADSALREANIEMIEQSKQCADWVMLDPTMEHEKKSLLFHAHQLYERMIQRAALN